MSKMSKEDKIAFLFILIAAVLRFYNYSDWSLSNDELSAMLRLQFPSFEEMIEKGVRTNDMHPLGVQSFLWFWTHLTGISEAAFRLPFVLFGIASAYVFYRIASFWFNKSSALFALCMFSILQFPVLYSQLARPYSPGLFFALLFVLSWTNILFQNSRVSIISREKLLWLAVFIFSGTACMYIHYFCFLFAGIVAASGLFYLNKKDIVWYILAGITMLILYIPNFNVFIYQFSIGGLGGEGGWLGPPKADAIILYIFYVLNNSYLIVFTCIVIIFISLLISKAKVRWNKFHSISILFFILPAGIAYFYSIFKNPVFQFSILLFSFPFLLLLICSFIPALEWNYKNLSLLFILTIIFLYSTVIENNFYRTENFANFRKVAMRTSVINSKFSSSDIVNTMNVINPFYINYYLNKFSPDIVIEKYKVDSAKDFIDIKKLAQLSKKKYFLHGWANTFHPLEIDQMIEEYFPYVIEDDSFFNSGLMVFSKEKMNGVDLSKKSFFKEYNSFEEAKWKNDSLYLTSVKSHSGKFSSLIMESMEFGPTFKSTVKNAGLKNGSVVQLSCWFFGRDSIHNAQLVFSVNRADKSIIWRSRTLTDFADNNEWNKTFLSYTIQEDLLPDDEISIYLWNPSKQTFYADDINIKVVQ